MVFIWFKNIVTPSFIIVAVFIHLKLCFGTSIYLNQTKSCQRTRILKLITADCYHLDLTEIPKNLPRNIEGKEKPFIKKIVILFIVSISKLGGGVLDGSFNRIRKLKSEHLQLYRHLQILYLGDNLISNIEPAALNHLSNLEVLDLSLNALLTFDYSIFNLQSLRKLFLSNNTMLIFNDKLITKPIIAPLEVIDISFCAFQSIPNFGYLPHLISFNYSGNDLNKFTMQTMLLFCTLEKIDIRFCNVDFNSFCDICEIHNWAHHKNITLYYNYQYDVCSSISTNSNCSISNINEEYVNYNQCLLFKEKRVYFRQYNFYWMHIFVTIGVIFLFSFVFFYIRSLNSFKYLCNY